MGTYISKIEVFLPEKVLTNQDLEKLFPDINVGKLENKVGIKQRHIAEPGQTALDLAESAAEKLLAKFDREKVEFILLCTQSPDYFLPTSACVLQDRLNLPTSVGALDFNLGCSGYIYGLSIAKGLINAGVAENVLFITTETYSKQIEPTDHSNMMIFGDAAAATLIEKSDEECIGNFVLGTDGSGANNLITKSGGFRHPEKLGCSEEDEFHPDYLYMNGPEIFNFTIETVPPLVNETLQNNAISIDALDYSIFHQANKYLLNHLRKKMKLPEEKFYIDMHNVANTVSSTIPIALHDCLTNEKLHSGDKVLLVGFGVGYSYGGTVISIK